MNKQKQIKDLETFIKFLKDFRTYNSLKQIQLIIQLEKQLEIMKKEVDNNA